LANHKSAIKRNRQNIRKRERNKVHRTQSRNATKKVLEAIGEGDKDAVAQQLKASIRTISKVASKGVLHKRTAARKISNLARAAHRLAVSG
jgi:small subunit ribosomal protein S20